MAALIHPLLALLASLTCQELAQQVAYLRAEKPSLRSKLLQREMREGLRKVPLIFRDRSGGIGAWVIDNELSIRVCGMR